VNAAPRLAARALFAAAIALQAAPASALTWSYCDFSSTTGLQINGDAKQQGNLLVLTPASNNKRGSAFTTAQVPFDATTSFHTYFRFRIGPNATGADGMAFVLHSGGAGALGANGGGLGYQGIIPSFAVELDTFDNGSGDPDANHVAVLFDGGVDIHVATATPSFPLTSAEDKYAWIDYDGPSKQLDVYLALQPLRPATPLLHATVDLDAHLGPDVRAGFTAATGGSNNTHTVIEWEMSTDGFPCCGQSPGGACNAALPVCGASTSLCVECNDDPDCGPAKPRCEKGASTCVECLDGADCAGTTPACVGSACVACVTDIDCASAPGGHACSPSGACVECVFDADCAAPKAKCDKAAGACVGCVTSADCGGATPACEPTSGTCVGCVDDSVCSGGTPVCDAHAKACVAGCHVVNGKDTCPDGMMCDEQDGALGACQPVGSSSSGMATGSTGVAGGGAGGAGGAGGLGGAGGGAIGPNRVEGDPIVPLGSGCWCGVGSGDVDARGLAAAALLALAASARRRARAKRRA
jgi:hypothetical protein